MIQGISGSSAQAAQVQALKAAKDADGDNDGTKAKAAAPPANNVGPAVLLSLSNVAKSVAGQGDPDHDGQ